MVTQDKNKLPHDWYTLDSQYFYRFWTPNKTTEWKIEGLIRQTPNYPHPPMRRQKFFGGGTKPLDGGNRPSYQIKLKKLCSCESTVCAHAQRSSLSCPCNSSSGRAGSSQVWLGEVGWGQQSLVMSVNMVDMSLCPNVCGLVIADCQHFVLHTRRRCKNVESLFCEYIYWSRRV